MMIPITRKEKYINEIVGGGNTAPETPQTREELFFADILGEVVAPSPITRAEKYLAKIANKYNGELPEPVTRIERFLARVAGMNVSIPTPITREEMFWADYALIVEKEISGIPPLTFNAIAGTLKNYRIYGNTETLTRSYSGSALLSFPIVDGVVSNYRVYGNTVNGESVGDKTENIFDKTKANRIYGTARNADGTMNYNTLASNYIDYYIPVKPNTDYSIKGKKTGTVGYVPSRIYFFDVNKVWINRTDQYGQESNIIQFTTPSSCNFIQMQEDQYREMDFVTFMIVEGSAVPENYIPYGYRVPITNNSETANIYLDEPLTKQGDNADYIDYAEQKRYNTDGTSEDVTLPALPAQSSTNSLSFGTAIQPSSVAVDVSEVVSCGDKVTDNQSVNYGKYKMPVTLTADSAETTDIYLDEPLAKSGNNADYIDYATQKRHNSDGTESSITLPEIAVTAGSNTLTVGTEVQPSNVYIKYEGVR